MTETHTDSSPGGLLEGLHPLETRTLLALEPQAGATERELEAAGLEAAQARTVVQWLLQKELIRASKTDRFTEVSLSEAGRRYLDAGTPEQRILDLLAGGERPTIRQLADHPGLAGEDVGAACGALKKAGAVEIGAGGALAPGDAGARAPFDATLELIRQLDAAGGACRLDALGTAEQQLVRDGARKRGQSKGAFRVADRTISTYVLTEAGQALRRALQESGMTGDEVSLLTPEMLRDGSWRQQRFRRFNLGLRPARVLIGHRHPYAAYLDQVRDRLLRLGFEEMRGSLVENEFWLMDALFMPQFHSARDIHDVYYVKQPARSRPIEAPFGERVAAAHQSGYSTGSRGWGYTFDMERTRRLVLRSQGTALSARTLAGGPKVPGKYFAIARCFRYDQIDATHAAEFYQVEGIVLGKDLNLRHLLGLLELFAREIAGAEEYRFAPGYFPFTEPSVELHVNHPRLGWIELGGSGIFRPELTAPLGVDVPVLAWGLGIDRMAMTALGINDIRQLFTDDLEFMRTRRPQTGREETGGANEHGPDTGRAPTSGGGH
ncbi:MAG: phenylalanine--tRNA ligase subunit alpha [Candidatus Eiseniibacteriota bacterium]|jgi:phenylalanyl-tRNA synthetase alpha chain